MRFKVNLNANPIIVKELRSRMRGVRAFAILTGMLVLLGLASYGLYRIVALTSAYSGVPLSPQIGQTIFAGLALLELVAICFITPALTAGAISGEREMQTYEMLMATPLNPASILRGKLFAALGYIFLLIFASVPMASLAFTFGGIASRDLIKVPVVLAAVAVTLGVLGVFMSAWLRRTGRATVLTYLVVLFLVFGTATAYAFAGVLRQGVPPRWLLVANPVSALFSAFTPSTTGSGLSSVLGSVGMVLGGNLGVMVDPGIAATGIPRPIYHYTLALYGGLALVLYLLATRLVRPVRRWRISRKEALGGVALCLLLAGGAALAYGTTADRYGTGLSPLPTATPAPFVVPAQVGVAPNKFMIVPGPVPTEAPIPQAPTPAPPPTSTPTPTPVPPPSLTPEVTSTLSEDDLTAIYAAVIRQLYTVDHTFGDQPPNWPVVYLIRTTDDSVGDPNIAQDAPQRLSEPIQKAVVAALAGLPTQPLWVDEKSQVPLDAKSGQVQGNGAIITVGNIHLQPDGSVLVPASLYFANEGATGKTYVLEQVDGAWQIVGTTGVEWIS